MYNLTKYSDIYSKASGFLWQFCRNEPALDANNAITAFTVANSITYSFKVKKN